MIDLSEVHAVSRCSFIQAWQEADRCALPTQFHAGEADGGLDLPTQIADASLLHLMCHQADVLV